MMADNSACCMRGLPRLLLGCLCPGLCSGSRPTRANGELPTCGRERSDLLQHVGQAEYWAHDEYTPERHTWATKAAAHIDLHTLLVT